MEREREIDRDRWAGPASVFLMDVCSNVNVELVASSAIKPGAVAI